MLYSARKHKKQPAPGSCLAIKHIYTMMSAPSLKCALGYGAKKVEPGILDELESSPKQKNNKL